VTRRAISANRIATGPAVWRASELRDVSEWTYVLTDMERNELRLAALAVAEQLPLSIKRDTFGLPTLGPRLREIRDDVLHRRGFAVIRGIPVEDWDLRTAVRAYWGLGTWLGEAVSQNRAGALLGHVCDVGASADHPRQRGFQSSDALPYHTDVAADIVSLLCLSPAKYGGLSSVASSGAIYNKLSEQNPDWAEVLARPLAWDRRGEIPLGAGPWYLLPVFSHHQGRLLTCFIRRFLEGSSAFADAPGLGTLERTAIEAISVLAASPEFHINMEFKAGDIQLINNHAILHNRTAYFDDAGAVPKRHLLRLWLATADGWELPEAYYARYPTRTKSGRPAGIVTPEGNRHVPINPS